MLRQFGVFIYRSFFHCPPAPRDLHSFPTRRSSDLACTVRVFRPGRFPPGLGSTRAVRRCWPAGTVLQRELIQIQRSEEHTSELQSHSDLVCRLLLEKKKMASRPMLAVVGYTDSPAP